MSVHSYPLYPDVARTFGREGDERDQLTTAREGLQILKRTGINQAQAIAKCKELDVDYAQAAARKLERNLVDISCEMQRIMDVMTKCEMITTIRAQVNGSARDLTDGADIEPGKLRERGTEDPLLHDVLLQRIEAIQLPEPEKRYSKNTLAPFREMWVQAMKLINPDEEIDITDFFGDDPMFVEAIENFKDPITHEPYVDVLRTRCGHHFSKTGILRWLESEGGQGQCPIGGCSSYITIATLVRDPAFEERSKKLQQRHNEKEAAKRMQTTAHTLD